MLSIFKLGSSAAASKYYEKADYYTKGEVGVDVSSQWVGGGVPDDKLGLPVEKSDFKELLDGNMPDGSSLGAKREGGKAHTAGWDLTFSAPKSVSIAALVGGDKRIIQAHQKAVERVSKLVEERYLVARRNTGKQGVEKIPLHKMQAGLFTHTTSRDLDPQLHTHMVLINGAQDKEGKFRSLYSKGIFDDKMFIGQIYRNELAQRLITLGYDINYNQKTGSFELDGIPKDLIKDFSSRRQSIEKVAEEFGYSGGKDMEKAALGSRSKKQDVTRESVISQWEATLEKNGFDLDKYVSEHQVPGDRIGKYQETQTSRGYNAFLLPVQKSTVIDPVKKAIEYVSHYDSSFQYKALTDRALKFSNGALTLNEVDVRLQSYLKSGTIIRSETHPSIYTTPKGAQRDALMLHIMKTEKGSVTPLNKGVDVRAIVDERGFSEGQERAFRDLLATNDRYFGLQGYAGVGKTYMMESVVKVAQGKGITVRGIAPYGKQAKVLQQETGVDSNTLKSHLIALQNGKIKVKKGEIWILDEAGATNSKDMTDLIVKAKQHDARLILSGDWKQHGAIEAGNPYLLMLKNGVSQTVNNDIKRQDPNPVLKDAIYDVIDGKVAAAFNKLDKSIVEDQKNPAMAMLQRFVDHSELNFDRFALLTPDLKTRDIANAYIREQLKERGLIGTSDTTVVNLVPARIDGPMKKYASSYQRGDFIRFHKDFKSLGVNKDDYLKVVEVAGDRIILEKGDKRIDWKPHQVAGNDSGSTAYRDKEERYSEGDKVRWKDKNEELGLKNGDEGTIKKLTDTSAQIEFDGKLVEIDTHNFRTKHFEPMYAQTTHIAQGSTYDYSYVVAESWRRNLVNQSSFYVAISRARKGAYIYTENSEKLKNDLEKRTGIKGNALSILSEEQKARYQPARKSKPHDPYDMLLNRYLPSKEVDKAKPEPNREKEL